MTSATFFLYSSLFILSVITVSLSVVSLFKSIFIYVKKEAGVGACFISQISIFFLIFLSETAYYIFTGRMNQFCVCSCKIFSLIVSFLFLCNKFIGKPSLKTSARFKNLLFVITCTIFYGSIACISLCLKQTPQVSITNTDFLSFERLSQLAFAIKWNCFDDFESLSAFTSYIYIIVPLLFFIGALIIDIIERVEKKYKIIDVLMLLSCVLNLIINKNIFEPKTLLGRSLEIFSIFLLFAIPIICFSYEAIFLYNETISSPSIVLIRKVYDSYRNPKRKNIYRSQKKIAQKVIENSRADDIVNKELSKRKYKKMLADLC